MSGYLKSSIARVLAIGSQFVLIALIGRLLGADATGVYASAFSFASIAAIVVSLGQMAASVKEIPTLLRAGERDAAGEVATRGLQLTAAGALVFAVPAVWLGSLATGSLAVGFLAWGMGAAMGLLGSFGSTARAFGSVFLSEAVRNVFWRVATIGLLLALPLASWGSIKWLLLGAVLAMLGSLVVSVIFLIRRQRLVWRVVSMTRLRAGLRVDLFNWLLQSAQAVLLNVDVVLIGALLGFREAGIYFVLTRIASLVSLPLSVTNPVILPAIGRVAKTGADAAVSRAVLRNARLNIGSAIALGLALGVVHEYAFRFLSATAIDGPTRIALGLLILSQVVNTAVGPTSFASQLFDVRLDAMKILIFCLVGLLFTLPLLAEAHGVVGAAGSVAFWRIMQNLATFELIRRRGGFNLLTGRAAVAQASSER